MNSHRHLRSGCRTHERSLTPQIRVQDTWTVIDTSDQGAGHMNSHWHLRSGCRTHERSLTPQIRVQDTWTVIDTSDQGAGHMNGHWHIRSGCRTHEQSLTPQIRVQDTWTVIDTSDQGAGHMNGHWHLRSACRTHEQSLIDTSDQGAGHMDADYWTHGCWLLDTYADYWTHGCWLLDTWMLTTGHTWMLTTGVIPLTLHTTRFTSLHSFAEPSMCGHLPVNETCLPPDPSMFEKIRLVRLSHFKAGSAATQGNMAAVYISKQTWCFLTTMAAVSSKR